MGTSGGLGVGIPDVKDLGTDSRRACAMPPDPMGRKTDGRTTEAPARPKRSGLRPSKGMTDYQHKGGYGDDAAWTNIFWTIAGILCACGLAVFLLTQ
jgi:hypothetical protein